MSEDDKLNWVNVINFLEKQYSQSSLKEKQWKYQREVLNQRVDSLQAELRSNSTICQSLVNRIKILEIALKQQRMQKGSQHLVEQEKLKTLIQKFKLHQEIDKNSHEEFLKDIVRDIRLYQSKPVRLIEKPEQNIASLIADKNDKIFEEKMKFGAHLDVVTTMVGFDFNQEPFIATSSQDCLIKIWNVNKIIKSNHLQPLHTLRKHTGPLFSLSCCQNPNNSSQKLLFSGGIQGDIKSWKLDLSSVEFSKSTLNGNQEEQTIWQLQAHQNKLLSSSSDGMVRLFKIQAHESVELTLLNTYKQKQFNQTAIKWISNDLFLAACSSAPRIHLWNTQGIITNKYLYETQHRKDPALAQVNHLQVMKDQKMILGGCEDGSVRIFDMNTGKIIKKLEGKGSVSSVLAWDWSIVVGDHNGCLSTWDSRMLKLIEQKQSIHLQKYDTGVTCLSRLNKYLMTSGADGIVKMFT